MQAFDLYILLRTQLVELNPSLVVPGHGPAFRLRTACSIAEQRHFGNVCARPLLISTPNFDCVWLITVGSDVKILVNTRHVDMPHFVTKGAAFFYVDTTIATFMQLLGVCKLQAIVVLSPSQRSCCGLGLLDAERVYLGDDVLISSNSYRTLENVRVYSVVRLQCN